MESGCEFQIGQLVEYKTWYEGEGSWISIENLVGIVLEIIQISEISETPRGVLKTKCGVIYDIKVYWIEEEKIETVPDLLLCKYEDKITI